MGSAAYVVPALMSMAFGAAQGAFSTSARPDSFGYAQNEATLNDFSNKLNNAYVGVNDYVKQGVTLPDATVQDLPSFDGLGLPMPIGVSGRAGSLANAPHMAGVDFGATGGAFGHHDYTPNTDAPPGDPRGASGNPNGTGPVGGGDTSGGGGNHRADLPGAQRQLFSGDTASALPTTGASAVPTSPLSLFSGSGVGPGLNAGAGMSGGGDPTHAALSLLMHVAGA